MEFHYVQKNPPSQLKGMEKKKQTLLLLYKQMAILALAAVAKRVQQMCL